MSILCKKQHVNIISLDWLPQIISSVRNAVATDHIQAKKINVGSQKYIVVQRHQKPAFYSSHLTKIAPPVTLKNRN
jgi:hypothetical protein